MYAPLFRQCYRGAEGGGTQRGKLWAMVHVKLSLIATPPCRDCSVRRGQNLPERARTMHELDRGNKARRTLRARATMFPIR